MINRIKPIATCTILGFVVTIFASPYEVKYAMAQSAPQENEISIPALQARVSQQGKSPEDVNRAMRDRFPNSNFPYYEPANGCSNPVDYTGWNEAFAAACNNHDICYTTPGNRRELCDSQMLREMLQICASNTDSSRRTFCEEKAEIYYAGIDELGQDAYNTAQEQQTGYIIAVYAWLNTSDLTGTWIESASVVTLDNRGCTLGFAGHLTVDGQDPQGRVFTLRQSGNQLTFPTVTTTWGSGSGTQSYQGTVSGNRVTYIISGNAGGGFTAQYTGIISNDGNRVSGEGVCRSNRGSATANVTFTWVRQVAP
jgi:hypothetical protein